MKINTSSWHYNLYLFYKWCRSKHYVESTNFKQFYYDYDNGYCEDSSTDSKYSFNTFKTYVNKTGNLRPIDFCTYWRWVLLYPILHIIYLIAIFTPAVIIALTIELKTYAFGVGAIIIVILGLLALFFLIALISSGLAAIHDRFTEWRQNRHKDDFFKKVGESMEDSSFCGVVEYEE